VLEFRAVMEANLKVDERVEKKSTFIEVVQGGSSRGFVMPMMDGGDSLTLETHTIENPRVAQPEFYPYLDGSVEALLSAFIESEESVLILMGPPGTGKTSGIAAAVDSLNLLPIYAKRADVITDKKFINFVFSASDTYMAKVGGTAARARSDLFVETLAHEKEFSHNGSIFKSKNEKKVEAEAVTTHEDDDDNNEVEVRVVKDEPKVPVIVVEDAELLMAPRSEGNLSMQELLNETDGIGSNHTRKIIFTTNLENVKGIEAALMRDGRCFGVFNFRMLTPAEAIVARKVAGLPDFEVEPTEDMPLATALRKPRRRIAMKNGKATLGFN
jgi:nitrogen fixation protein FixH